MLSAKLHPMAGGSYCAIIAGRCAFKGNASDARRMVKAARKSGDDPRAFVGQSPRTNLGDAWT